MLEQFWPARAYDAFVMSTKPTPPDKAPKTSPTTLAQSLDFAAWLYGALLLALMGVRHGLGDRFSWSFAINSLFFHAFWPASPVLVLAIVRRSRASLTVSGLSTLLFVAHWGELFVPNVHSVSATGQTIRVMTYNALGYNTDTAGTIRAVRDVDADLVALQELAPEHAAALEQAFSAKYSHRLIDARPGVTGCGVLSRYPLRQIDPGPLAALPWIGTPMAVEIDFPGQSVRFVNFHTYAGPMYVRMREQQAQALADFALAHPGPLLFAGDLNATDQNHAYALIARTMHDAWRDAGWGMGHTFPGEPTPDVGGSRPIILGIPVPKWLVRIDYIFHSATFVTLDAHLGPGDAGSDHRAVVATLSVNASDAGK